MPTGTHNDELRHQTEAKHGVKPHHTRGDKRAVEEKIRQMQDESRKTEKIE